MNPENLRIIANKIINLGDSMRKFVNELDKTYLQRYRKTNFSDGLAFKIQYSGFSKTQEEVTCDLNMFKKLEIPLHRSSYVERSHQLDKTMMTDYNNQLDNKINLFLKNDINYKDVQQIYAVDGSDINISGKLKANGKKLDKQSKTKNSYKFNNKNKETITAMTISVHNVFYGCDTKTQLFRHSNERGGFLEMYNNIEHKNNVYVFDRGFFSYKLAEHINMTDNFFIFRLSHNLPFLKETIVHLDDYTTDITKCKLGKKCTLKKLRIITYTIGKENYYLATNLFNKYSAEELKDIYHKRWNIEEYFKHLKKDTCFGHMLEKTEECIINTIKAHQIVSKIAYLIKHIFEKYKTDDDELIINKSLLMKGLYFDFMLRFIYGNTEHKQFDEKYIIQFLLNYVKYVRSKKGRKNPRIAKHPFLKWHILRHRNTKKKGKKKKKHVKKHVKKETKFFVKSSKVNSSTTKVGKG